MSHMMTAFSPGILKLFWHNLMCYFSTIIYILFKYGAACAFFNCYLIPYSFQTCLNLRPAGGLLLRTAPSGFFQLVQKRRRAAPPFLAHLIIHLFCTCCENFRPRSRKVRSPGHIKWPHLIKCLNVRQRYTDWTFALKLSAIATSNIVYKTYIS